MESFNEDELKAAQKAILSTIRKTEKVKETLSKKQPPGSPQLALAVRRLRVFETMSAFIAKALNEESQYMYTKEDLKTAAIMIPTITRQVEAMKSKFSEGTSQHTLAVRRIRAFQIAMTLIDQELEEIT